MITGTRCHSSDSRIVRTTSIPVIPGIIQSNKTKSGRSRSNTSSASSPLAAEQVEYP